MAGRHEDDSLSSSIRALFFSDASAFTTNDIMRALGPGYLRRDVSRVLYRLEEAGLIERILESPPTWISHVQVKQKPGGYGPSTRWRNERDDDYAFDERVPQRGTRMGGASVSMGGATPTHQSQILEALLHSSNPLTATEIAKEIGLRGAAAINSDLIAMEKEGLLRKVIQSKGPLLWDLASRPEREGPNPNPKIMPHSYNTRSKSQSPNNSKTGKTPPARKPSSSSSSTTPPTIATTTRKINMGQPSGFVSSSVDPFCATAGAEKSRSLILQYLSNASEERKAITIANDIGLSRHDVNSLLYGLEREGLVTCYSGTGPPAWVIKKSRMVVSSSIGRGSRLRTLMKEAKDKKQNFVRKGQLVSVGGLGSVPSSEAPPPGPSSSSSAAQSNNEVVMSSPPVSPPSSPPVHSSTLPSASPSSHSSPPPPPTLSVMEPYSCSPMAAALANELTRNPVSVLSEFCQIQKLELSFPIVAEHGPPHFKSFTIAASCLPFYAEAKASTKKDAKRMAADLALQRIRACIVVTRAERGGPAWFTDSTPTGGYTDERYEAEQEMEEGPTLHDHIDGIAHSLHTRLELALGSPQPGRKVIACFIMEDASTKQLEVISFGSGTRTVSGDVIDRNGEVVNDSHAEIIARRGLKRFFYQELRVYYEDGESVDTIFEPIEGGDGSKVRVKDSIKFHLYISTAPCGDGAQFSRQDSQNRLPPQGSLHCPTKDARAQGILRTKMEGGEGTIPIGTDANPQTWDGILQGGRLRTMSCSDKIGSWNVLGLQGSLLSVFMEPVYLFSLTLGSLHHHGHLSRAVCCRFQELGQSLRPPYMVNHPVLGRVRGGDEMRRHTEKTSNLSMNWVINDAAPELTDGGTGRPVSSSSSSSQLSRLNIFAQFRSLCELTGRTSYLNIESYFEAKGLAGDYQEMKRLLYRYCIEKGYGLWMSKPLEMNQFSHSEVPMDV